jgi:hypothetical protein
MAFALMGMTTKEISEFADQLADVASTQMEIALDNHLGSYMRCQGYTGKNGLMGWIGFGVDLFNPFDDLAILADLGTLVDFDPLQESPEDYSSRVWKQIWTQRAVHRPIIFIPF